MLGQMELAFSEEILCNGTKKYQKILSVNAC